MWSSVQTTETFSISAIRLFCFLIIPVLTGVALLISLNNFSFAFTTWLTVWLKRPSFWPVLAYNMPSSLSLIISTFWFKVSDVGLFFSSLEHLEVIVRLLIGLMLILFVSGIGRPKEKVRDGQWPIGGAVRTHTKLFGSVCFLIWAQFMAPQNNYSSNIKDHWWQVTITSTIIKKF